MSGPSWVRYGLRHGWLWSGVVPARELSGADFWSQAVRVTCIAEGGNLDMVQCYDAGIFTAGPLGATALFGTLGALLAEIPIDTLRKHLGSLCGEVGLGYCGKAFTVGLNTASADDLRSAFTANEDATTWGPEDPGARLARRWVEAFAALLADPSARRGIARASGHTLTTYLSAEAGALLGAGTVGEAAWLGAASPPQAARKAVACFLSFAINNPKGAMRLLRAAGPDADRMLATAATPGAWPETFGQRVGRTRAALAGESW